MVQGDQGSARSLDDVFPVISSWVSGALSDFRARDLDLLEYSVGEWSCAFRIAVYLEQRVDPAWRVDIEYDRQGVRGQQKRRGLDSNASTMRPDIAIHRRGSEDIRDNLLLLEIKRIWTPGGDPDDLAKVRRAVSGELEFQYQFAAAIGLGDSGSRFNPTWTLMTAGGVMLVDEKRILA
ncbi:hypothetical protein [Micromonospora aurantiaca]|uniref:hypothetical protein n=1 Tax=Micromonospora aurantiaca (nom. illeg.) TaxID=47850 RepID=UPI0011A0AD91|nr:hypothetical protein [Micromonospora aurantiaca]UFN96799.1 hypothetical protein LF814_11985 [Micromonospora aurantiaca]